MYQTASCLQFYYRWLTRQARESFIHLPRRNRRGWEGIKKFSPKKEPIRSLLVAISAMLEHEPLLGANRILIGCGHLKTPWYRRYHFKIKTGQTDTDEMAELIEFIVMLLHKMLLRLNVGDEDDSREKHRSEYPRVELESKIRTQVCHERYSTESWAFRGSEG